MATLVDSLPGLVSYLNSIPEVAALCTGRVYGGAFPEKYPLTTDGKPFPGLVINHSGGAAITFSTWPIAATSKDLRAYGRTLMESLQVWNAAAGALKAMRRGTYGGVRMYSCALDGPVGPMLEQDSEWPLTFSTFTLLASEV
jgi:hypothetical protein